MALPSATPPAPVTAILLLLASVLATPASAQPLTPACNLRCAAPRVCSPTDRACQRHNQQVATCQADQASCQTKFMAYDAYLKQMGAGVTPLTLPPLYREVLDPLFTQAPLMGYFYGYSNRQPPGNATTDCDRTWYNDIGYVNEIQSGTLAENGVSRGFYWLLHEIAHYEQCRVVGGRDAFARMWWDHLSETELMSLIETGGWGVIHDQMVMEQEANDRAVEILGDLARCCIHPTSGLLVRPLVVTPLQVSPASLPLGSAVTFSATASHGAQPLTWGWEVRRPSGGAWIPLPETGGSATFIPDAQGDWVVRLSVAQPPPGLPNDHEETRTFRVTAPLPRVVSVVVAPATVIGGATAQGTLWVEDMAPGSPVQVTLQSNDVSLVQVPASISVVAGPDGRGTAAFPVSTVLLPVDRNVAIIATGAGGSATGTLFVGGLILEGMMVDRDRLLVGEPVQVEIGFNRAAPVDIVIQLESSDARALGVPAQVILPRGQRSVTVPLRAATTLTEETPVTLRARLAHDPQRTMEQVLRVRPPG